MRTLITVTILLIVALNCNCDITKSINSLSSKLLQAFPNGENSFVSPISIATSLAVLHSGSNGKTQDEITKLLEVNGNKNLYAEFKKLLQSLQKEKVFKTVNIGLITDGTNIGKSFKKLSRNYFNTEFFNVDVQSETLLKKLNGFIKTNTNGEIEDFFKEPLSSDTVFTYLNINTFIGKWINAFNTSSTKSMMFNNADEQKPIVKMMNSKNQDLKYYNDDQVEVIQLPYEKEFNLLVLLPKKGVPISQVIAEMNEKIQMQREMVIVHDFTFPKFTLDKEIDLKEVLMKLNLVTIFGNQANLDKISRSSGLKVGEMKHRAKIEVDEEGTKSTAVTSFNLVPKFGADEIEEIVVDRPFAFCITHNGEYNDNTILFSGVINNL